MNHSFRCFIHISITLALGLGAVIAAPAQNAALEGTTAAASNSAVAQSQKIGVDAGASSSVNRKVASQVTATAPDGKNLDVLFEDPDELARDLAALAGPSVGPDGGQIVVGAAFL